MMKKINRRQFIRRSGLVTLAGLGGAQVGFGRQILNGINGGNGTDQSKDLLVYVFLNGGMDGLNMVPPRSGNDYNQYSTVLRPGLHIPNTESLPLNGTNAFGMHPLASGLQSLYNENKMAIVHATGLLEANRSHFVATALMELGVQNTSENLGSGWLTRYFDSSLSTPDDAVIPNVVPAYNNTDAVLGNPAALVMGQPTEFSLNLGHWAWENAMQSTLSEIFAAPQSIEDITAHQTLNASEVIQGIDWENYTTDGNAQYPESFFGDQLKTIAQLHKENVDLEVAYVPTGGWDTHNNQGTGTTGEFALLVQDLSDGLRALYEDLNATHEGRFTIIVQSEFGRRAYENTTSGTDHGYGNPIFVIGDHVNGGFYGQFPGLSPDQLFENGDVNATVDYRDVVCEVLMKRMQNRFLGFIFPGYSDYSPLGVVSGADLLPVYDVDYDPIFSSGFD